MITKQELKNQYFNLRMTRRKYTAGIYGSILNKITNKEIDCKAELDENEIMQLIKKEYKERLDELESFKQAGRDTTLQEEAIAYMEQFLLPTKISPEEYLAKVKELFTDFDSKPKKEQIGLLKNLQNKYTVNISDVIKLL